MNASAAPEIVLVNQSVNLTLEVKTAYPIDLVLGSLLNSSGNTVESFVDTFYPDANSTYRFMVNITSRTESLGNYSLNLTTIRNTNNTITTAFKADIFEVFAALNQTINVN